MWTWNAACVVIGYLVATSAFTSPGLSSSGAQSRQDASSSALVAPAQALVRSRLPHCAHLFRLRRRKCCSLTQQRIWQLCPIVPQRPRAMLYVRASRCSVAIALHLGPIIVPRRATMVSPSQGTPLLIAQGGLLRVSESPRSTQYRPITYHNRRRRRRWRRPSRTPAAGAS